MKYARLRHTWYDVMKTELLLLLILHVFNTVKTEFRHHQDRYAKDNITAYPWFSTVQQYKAEEKKVTGITNIKHQTGVTSPEESLEEGRAAVASPKVKPREKVHGVSRIFEETRRFYPTESVFSTDGSAKGREKKEKAYFLNEGIKSSKPTNKFTELETSTKSFPYEKSSFYLLSPASEKKSNELRLPPTLANSRIINLTEGETYGRSRQVSEKINSPNPSFTENSLPFQNDGYRERNSNLNLFRQISDLRFAEPLVALTDTLESDGCVKNVVEDFTVSDDLVTGDVLTDRNGAEKLTAALVSNNDDLDGMTDIIESIMQKHPRITSISVTAFNRAKKSETSQTVYRKENDLFVDRQSSGYPKFLTDKKSSWTPLFWNCVTKVWIFGYSFTAENEDKRIDATLYFNANDINGTVDQCKTSFNQILDGGPKCDSATTKCAPLARTGFMIGGYKCVCLEGFYFPLTSQTDDKYFKGVDIEQAPGNRNSSQFKCFPCPETCAGSCTLSGFCIFQRNSLLSNSVLSVQLFCILTASVLTVLVFRHRKCKTIATGMWTIMEMILLGSIILYGTIIIRTFNPSTVLCLIEPWCREVGFVLCYGAIILKLYRILIEFRTRKAHRWVIRDKDLLKYLLGMVIVVFGYMSAWTATNLYLIQRENYSMLSTGVTPEGFHFNTCKAVWWDYITQTSEILILIFGVHLSYASRNATTQFRERCFLCISISVEALVSSIFYILRSFYWGATSHPDLDLVSNFIRCQLTTTVVLLLLFTPKWWYQKIQLNKARVSRNYLMQESGRGPLEAFKPQDGVTATNSDVEGEFGLADMNPEDIRAELKRLYTQLEVLKNKTIRFDNPHISKRRGGRKMAHRRFSLQALRHQTQRLSAKHTDVEVTEAEASRTPEDSVCSNEGPSIIINDGPSEVVHMTPKKVQI